jgi:hypothetical protein
LVLAMAAEGVTRRQMSAVMSRSMTAIGIAVDRARHNPSARQMATVVRDILVREAAPIALPVPAAEHQAA